MRNEIYNCLQARWLPELTRDKLPSVDTEELMTLVNFTNYDLTYTMGQAGPRAADGGVKPNPGRFYGADGEPESIKRIIIYPFERKSIRRIKHNQYATISLYDTKSDWIMIDRKRVTNRLITIASTRNPYTYAPGVLGWLEKKYMEHIISNSDLIFFD